jgi:hypothetical protein
MLRPAAFETHPVPERVPAIANSFGGRDLANVQQSTYFFVFLLTEGTGQYTIG